MNEENTKTQDDGYQTIDVSKPQQEEPEKDRESSYFTFDVDYDDEEEDYKSKKGKEILGQFTKGFSSFI